MACAVPGDRFAGADGRRTRMNGGNPHGVDAARRLLIATCVLLFLSSAVVGQNTGKEVIGYFPSWKWRAKDNPLTPSKIPYAKLSTINYAFFIPLPDGSIVGKDSVGDGLYLRGTPDELLVSLAHRHGVKVVLSIGGWDDSENFPAVASEATTRRIFAHSCLDAVRMYGFDGIDIDWEYPGFKDHGGTPVDRTNFTLLLTAIRDSLDLAGRSAGKKLILTAALPSGGENLLHIDVKAIAVILDQLNIMTYDFYGSWDPVANHNSPLYPSAGADPARCVDSSFRLFRQGYCIPGTSINLGVPFYGHSFADCVALNASHSGTDTVHFASSGMVYRDIASSRNKFIRYWDNRAQVPYLVNNKWKVLVSYDDEQSIRAKAEYVIDCGAHGVIIWELTGDYMPDGSTPLLDALTDALHPVKPVLH